MSSPHRQEAKVVDYLLVALAGIFCSLLSCIVVYGFFYSWITPMPQTEMGILWYISRVASVGSIGYAIIIYTPKFISRVILAHERVITSRSLKKTNSSSKPTTF